MSIKTRIDRLTAQMKGPHIFPAISMLTETDSGFCLACSLWDGKPGSSQPGEVSRYFSTQADAEAAYQKFLTAHPSARGLEPKLIFIDV